MTEKSVYISLARVFAAITIITLHTDETWLIISNESYWLIDNIIIGITRCAVPIFFMVTGATLINYRERYDTKQFYKKRLIQVIIPLLIWYFFAIIFEKLTKTSGISFIYWFMFALIGMYLCIPLFSALKDELKQPVILSVIIISFILNYLIPFLADIFHFPISNILPPFNVGQDFIIYILLGHLIHTNKIDVKLQIVSYISSLIGLFIIIYGTYTRSLKTGILDDTFGNTLNLPCLLWSIGAFICIKQLGQIIHNNTVIKILYFLDGYAMASYVLHQYVLRYIIRPHVGDVYSIAYKLGTPILNFFICVAIAHIIKKVPLLRKTLP